MNIELTETTINNTLKHCNSPCFIRDSILSGFGVRIYRPGKVSYIIEPTIDESTKRMVIGKYPQLCASEARALANNKVQELTIPSTATFPALYVTYNNYTTQILLKYSSISEYSIPIKQALNHSINGITARYIQTRSNQ